MAEASKESSPPSVFVNSEPMREDQVQNAVKFLSHPRVRGSPVIYRRSFLERKGLTKEEIDEAFRRVPDPTPTISNAPTTVTNQDSHAKSSANINPQAPSQSLQPAVVTPAGVISKVGTFSRFHWSHALLAVGVLAASGAGAAVLFKIIVEVVTPEWVDYFEHLTERNIVGLKGSATTFSRQSNTPRRISIAEQDDHRVSVSRQSYANGNADFDLRSGRSSSPPATVESSVAPHPKSYAESVAMVQRGERPPNIRKINDLPSNPNQPVSIPHITPRPQPWEFGLAQNTSNHVLHSQESSDGLDSIFQDNGLGNQLNGDSSVPWWQRKNVRITEIESEDEHKTGSSSVLTNGRPVQRSWVPPQPPPVVMPEAAAAIRQPKKSLIQKEELTDDQLLARSSDITDELQRITKISESGGVEETNGGISELNRNEIQNEDNSYIET
ncbi:unnamed protein product [Ilex paraguariensis]|uniref:Peroxisomal membrane protein PEX14 n=1 Tax=Ilex paraguariensis TaxID=185542 RepID=A0ABC8T8E7_9AQUA